nr:GGDEF domain-containing protein [Lysobacter sp. CAU 1642]
MAAQFDSRRGRMLASADPAPLLWVAFGVVLFNLWDRWLDASVAQSTLWVRLACGAIFATCYALLRRRSIAARWSIVIYAIAFLAGQWGIALAVLQLPRGFEFGMPSVLLFPLALAFYPVAPQRFILIALSGALGLAALMFGAGVETRPAANFLLMYGLSTWVGSIALRVQMRLQLRLFLLEQRHAETARTDVLTGLMNRRSLEEAAGQRLRDARNQQRPLSVLLMDLDHFKSINDLHGHDIGDQALCHAAACFASTIRQGDAVGRWGGEEFLAILVDTRLDSAAQVGERCIEALAASPLPLDRGESLRMGVSVGAAEWQSGESLDDLLRRADVALYRAKQDGRGILRRAEAVA